MSSHNYVQSSSSIDKSFNIPNSRSTHFERKCDGAQSAVGMSRRKIRGIPFGVPSLSLKKTHVGWQSYVIAITGQTNALKSNGKRDQGSARSVDIPNGMAANTVNAAVTIPAFTACVFPNPKSEFRELGLGGGGGGEPFFWLPLCCCCFLFFNKYTYIYIYAIHFVRG